MAGGQQASALRKIFAGFLRRSGIGGSDREIQGNASEAIQSFDTGPLKQVATVHDSDYEEFREEDAAGLGRGWKKVNLYLFIRRD